jgi:uncharacterized protein RhaS with RHS repeats
MRAFALGVSSRGYTYGGMAYANPHAVTQIANGVSTTTLQYDNDGNVSQKTVDGTTTTYVYDYANRLIALGVGGATTTYGYDWAGKLCTKLTFSSVTTLVLPKWSVVRSSRPASENLHSSRHYRIAGISGHIGHCARERALAINAARW